MADKHVFENEDSDDQKAEEEEQTTCCKRHLGQFRPFSILSFYIVYISKIFSDTLVTFVLNSSF